MRRCRAGTRRSTSAVRRVADLGVYCTTASLRSTSSKAATAARCEDAVTVNPPGARTTSRRCSIHTECFPAAHREHPRGTVAPGQLGARTRGCLRGDLATHRARIAGSRRTAEHRDSGRNSSGSTAGAHRRTRWTGPPERITAAVCGPRCPGDRGVRARSRSRPALPDAAGDEPGRTAPEVDHEHDRGRPRWLLRWIYTAAPAHGTGAAAP